MGERRTAILVTSPGAGRAGELDVARALDDAGWQATSVAPGDVAGLDADAAGKLAGAGVERVVAAGGDGTVGAAASLASRLGVPLAVVPLGTANDFARAVHLPDDPAEALALAAGPGTRMADVEVGEVDGIAFVNLVAIGVSTSASRRAAELKPALGAAAYPAGAALAAAGGEMEPLPVGVDVDGRSALRGDALQVFVAATGAFGGIASVVAEHVHEAAPDAEPEAEPGPGPDRSDAEPPKPGDPGTLTVVVVPAEAGPFERIGHLFSLFSGSLAERDDVWSATGSKIRIDLGRPVPMVVDGELLEPRPGCHVVLRSPAVRLLVP